jgi:hypothetical protein
MADGEDQFAETEGIGGVNIALPAAISTQEDVDSRDDARP